MLLYTNNHLTEQRLHSWDHQKYTIFTTQENLKKYKQPIEIMLLFFRHISTMGRQAEYQTHQQPTLEFKCSR